MELPTNIIERDVYDFETMTRGDVYLVTAFRAADVALHGLATTIWWCRGVLRVISRVYAGVG